MRNAIGIVAAAGLLLLGIAAASPAQAVGANRESADKLLCSPTANGGTLVHGVCVLQGATAGEPYEAFIITSLIAGGTFAIISGSPPPGLKMPAVYGAAGTIVAGQPSRRGTFNFTVKGTDDLGEPLRQAYRIKVGPPAPLRVVLPAGGSTLTPGTVGAPYSQMFFLSGGIRPYAWSVTAGTLPPGLKLITAGGPSDRHNELAGKPTKAGTFTFTMKVTDHGGRHASQRFKLTIQP